MDPDEFRGRPEAYAEWARLNFRDSWQFCARHWSPCPVEGKPGMLVSVILFSESFAFVPDDVAKSRNLTTALNSWWANQTVPVCCRLGDEKMDWLWWVAEAAEDRQAFCRAFGPKGIRVCWRPSGHLGEHEWQRPMPRSVFDLMAEVHP